MIFVDAPKCVEILEYEFPFIPMLKALSLGAGMRCIPGSISTTLPWAGSNFILKEGEDMKVNFAFLLACLTQS